MKWITIIFQHPTLVYIFLSLSSNQFKWFYLNIIFCPVFFKISRQAFPSRSCGRTRTSRRRIWRRRTSGRREASNDRARTSPALPVVDERRRLELERRFEPRNAVRRSRRRTTEATNDAIKDRRTSLSFLFKFYFDCLWLFFLSISLSRSQFKGAITCLYICK